MCCSLRLWSCMEKLIPQMMSSATSPAPCARKRNQTRARSHNARRVARCRVLVVAKASGADTDSVTRTGTTTHLQKKVRGTLIHRWLLIHPLVSIILVFSLCIAVLSGIVQCVQCQKWSHNNCVGTPAINNEDQVADWTCGTCDADMARALHLALNCRSRRGRD